MIFLLASLNQKLEKSLSSPFLVHDHPQTNVLLQYSNSSEIPFYSLSGALAGDVNKADADLLYYNRTGPLADPGREIVAWIKVPDPEDPSKYMVVQFICARPTTVDGIHNCQSILTENARGRTNLVLGPGGNLTFANGVGPWLTNPKDAEMYAIGLKKFIDGANAYPGLNVTSPAGTHDLEWYINYLNANAKVSNNRKYSLFPAHVSKSYMESPHINIFRLGWRLLSWALCR